MEEHEVTALLCADVDGIVVGAVHIHSIIAPEVGVEVTKASSDAKAG